jgi:DNA mismatch endonuclease (patch repair protein)
MPDIVDPATRSRMMAGIRAKNTRPELAIRRALHRRGYRYVLHSPLVPGKPDLVFPARRAVIFVHGCFWHGHDCRYFKMPSTRPEFWGQKIRRNVARDVEVRELLKRQGWRHLTIWECATRGQGKDSVETVASQAAAWLEGTVLTAEIRGT